jgi:hypothetical protein
MNLEISRDRSIHRGDSRLRCEAADYAVPSVTQCAPTWANVSVAEGLPPSSSARRTGGRRRVYVCDAAIFASVINGKIPFCAAGTVWMGYPNSQHCQKHDLET